MQFDGLVVELKQHILSFLELNLDRSSKVEPLLKSLFGYFVCDTARSVYLLYPFVSSNNFNIISKIKLQRLLGFHKLSFVIPENFLQNNPRLCSLSRVLPHTEKSMFSILQHSFRRLTFGYHCNYLNLLCFLPAMTSLTHLDASVNSLSLDQQEWIFKVPNLRVLHLRGCGLENEIVRKLFKHEKLTSLNVSQNAISGEALELLPANNNIHRLDFGYNSELGMQGIQYMASNSSITDSNIRCCDVTNEMLQELLRNKNMYKLNLCGNTELGPQMPSMKEWKHLRYLDISQITGLKSLTFLPCTITNLDVSQCELRGDAFAYLSQMPLLSLKCYGTRLTKTMLMMLFNHASLECLDISTCNLHDDDILPLLLPSCKLTSLSLHFNEVTDKLCKALISQSKLNSLNLAETMITEAGLFELPSNTSLSFLEVSMNAKMTNNLHYSILNSSKNLHTLWIHGNSMSQDYKTMLLQHCTWITDLQL